MFATSWHELACARLVFQGFTVKVSRGKSGRCSESDFHICKRCRKSIVFFIDKIGIMILSGLFIVLFVLSRNFGIFSSIHEVSRKTIGEFSMAAGVGISAVVLLPSGIIAFVYGMLILGFADTSANIIGSKWKIWEFKIMSQSKSIGGTTAFFLCSIMISYFTAYYVGLDIKLDMLLVLCLTLTLVEAVHIFGLDNLTLPLLSGIFWNYFTV